MRRRDRDTTLISDETARTLDDAVKPVVFPAKPTYFRSSAVNRYLYFIFILLVYLFVRGGNKIRKIKRIIFRRPMGRRNVFGVRAQWYLAIWVGSPGQLGQPALWRV